MLMMISYSHLLLSLLFSLFLSSFVNSQSCFTPGKTWSPEQTQVIDIVLGISSAIECQTECTAAQDCTYFTWNTENHSLYPLMCELFQIVPEATVDCSDCISGPSVCSTCSQSYACAAQGSTLLDVSAGVQSETECRSMCVDLNTCEFYTWYSDVSPVFTYDCFLYSTCVPTEETFPGCFTGPRDCSSTPPSPTAAPTTTPPTAPPQGGGVLLMGGYVNGTRSGSVEVIGNCNLLLQDLPVQVYFGAAAILDGSVYFCGGYNGDDTSAACYIRGGTGAWVSGPEMYYDRDLLTLNTVGSKLVAMGGFGSGLRHNSIEILTTGSTEWEIQSFHIEPARSQHCAVTISETEIFLAGGWTGNVRLANTEILDITTGAVTKHADLPAARDNHACSLYQDKILLTGGDLGSGGMTSVLILDYRNEGSSWTVGSPLVRRRTFHTMEIVDGIPTVFGGETADGSVEELLVDGWVERTAEIAHRHSHASVVIC